MLRDILNKLSEWVYLVSVGVAVVGFLEFEVLSLGLSVYMLVLSILLSYLKDE